MHMLVIYVWCYLSRTLKKLHAPAEGRTGDPSIYSRALYHVAIKAGLYRKAIQVYDIPYLYPVTFMRHFQAYICRDLAKNAYLSWRNRKLHQP